MVAGSSTGGPSVAAGGGAGVERPGERPLSDVRFLTVAEVASLMRVSKMTVYRLVHAGGLPAVRVGRSFRVPEQAVHEYLRDAYYDVG
jgi:excisionase family DNA binding protein